MPKLDITTEEQHMIIEALITISKSAKRAQKTSQSPQIREVYQKHEQTITQVLLKVQAAK